MSYISGELKVQIEHAALKRAMNYILSSGKTGSLANSILAPDFTLGSLNG